MQIMSLERLLILVVLLDIVFGVDTNNDVDAVCDLASAKSGDSCTPSCLRYEASSFSRSPSVVTFFPRGRLGNMISAFLTLMWLQLETGMDVYFELSSLIAMQHVFQNVQMKTLEEDLCSWESFPWQMYESNVEHLAQKKWQKGKAIQIHVDSSMYLKQELQGGSRWYEQFRAQSKRALTFRPKFANWAQNLLQNFAEEFRQRRKIGKDQEITFVGIHNRRTDYLAFRAKKLGLRPLYASYFTDAMSYFREEYELPLFVFVSDDMQWAEENVDSVDDLFMGGCGHVDDADCVANDLALLANCNHTITTHGTFGHWASFLAGGEIYTEYGPIVPNPYS